MNTRTRPILLLSLLSACFMLLTPDPVEAQSAQTSRRLVEVQPKGKAMQSAPQTVKVAREFFKYLGSDQDISKDTAGQLRWLSKDLRAAMSKKVEFEDLQAAKEPTDKRDYPRNSSFVGAWDHPSTYSILGSRRYNERAIVDVEYKWGAGTNYPGHKRLMSFVFVMELATWKLADVYTYTGEFESSESLNSYFRQTY